MYDAPDPFATIRWMVWLIVLVDAACCGVAGAVLAKRKGLALQLGAVLGALFSLLGVLIVWALPEDRDAVDRQQVEARQAKRCPDCAELVRYRAKVCRWCRHAFDPAR